MLGPGPLHPHFQEGVWRMEKYRPHWKPQKTRASDGAALGNSQGKGHQASHTWSQIPYQGLGPRPLPSVEGGFFTTGPQGSPSLTVNLVEGVTAFMIEVP